MHTLQIGAILQGGKYIIKKVLGQGGFGITYLTEHSMLGTEVAIKEFFMKDYCSRDETTTQISISTESGREQVARFKEKFLKEARNIAKLHHPNIIRITDVFEENGTAYYVMDYCEGGSLADLVKLHPKGLGEELALKYIRQVASALEHIHEHRMNHLDVKPANILINLHDKAVLIDFGLSKQYDIKGSQTSTTPVGISHGYAPIEQYKQRGVSEFSPSTDIYSLGATLFKLITGQTPPDAQILIEESLPSFEASNGIKNAILKAMQLKRADRPQSVSEWLALIDGKDELISKNTEKRTIEQKANQKSCNTETTELVNDDVSKKEGKLNRINCNNNVVEAGTGNKDNKYNCPSSNSIKEKNLQWTPKMIKSYAIVMAILLIILIFCYSKGIIFPWVNIFGVICLLVGSIVIIKERKDAGRQITISKKNIVYAAVYFSFIAIWILSISEKSYYEKAVEYWETGDDLKAIEYLEKGHAKGDKDAIGLLAWYYINGGNFIQPDSIKAYTLSKESAEKGSSLGTYANAYCLYWGIGVTADEVKAYTLFKKAAKEQPEAQVWLSRIGKDHNDHIWVDMGLSVKWAVCNIGASNKYERGDFYAWAETAVKQEYSRESYFDKDCNIFFKGSRTTLSNEVISHSTGLTSISPTSQYDVAYSKLGGKWRIPTEEDFQELIVNCEIEKQSNGILLISKINQSTLFFPTAGIISGTDIKGTNLVGGYWTSTLSSENNFDNYDARAWLINLEDQNIAHIYSASRCNGYCVRPVLAE